MAYAVSVYDKIWNIFMSCVILWTVYGRRAVCQYVRQYEVILDTLL
jgi:hypothetical protein